MRKHQATSEALQNLTEKELKILSLLNPPPDLKGADWAEDNFYLSREDSSEHGKYTFDRAPYQREILNAFTDPEIEKAVWVASSQVGKTLMMKITAAYYIAQDPSPILMVEPTIQMAEDFSKDRFSTMVRDNPVLHDKIADPKSRNSGNTILHKTFAGGHFTLVGANAPSGLASRPIRVLLIDEVDRFNESAGSEGDPVELAVKRTTTFDNRKIVIVSSPGNAGSSRIWPEFEETNQTYFHVPCPVCGHFQRLTWEQIKFPDKNPKNTFYECIACKSQLTEVDKYKMIAKYKLVPTFPERSKKPGFHISELYSTFSTWSKMVENFLKANKEAKAGNNELLKVFVNTSLAELWEDLDTAAIDETKLEIRAKEEYFLESPPTIPENVLVISTGVDVQDDRVEILDIGWGLNEESWNLCFKALYGNPSKIDFWQSVEDYLSQDFLHAYGIKMGRTAVGFDTGGHHTDDVYKFIKKYKTKRYFAFKGMAGNGRPIVSNPSRNNRFKLPLFLIGVDTAKEKIYTRLGIDEPGPGYMHYNKNFDHEFFKQLTSARQVKRYSRGRMTIGWEKMSGRRDEALDCTVYALASFNLLNANLPAIEKHLKEEAENHKINTPEPKPAATQIIQPNRQFPAQRPSYSVNSWKKW